MSFALPLAEDKIKRQQVITLHLIVCFILITTGSFVWFVQYMVSGLSGDKRAAFVSFTIHNLWSLAIIVSGLLLLGLTLFKNKWLLQKRVNKVVRIIQWLVIVCFAIFAAGYSLKVPAVIYSVLACIILFAIYWENISTHELSIHIDERGIKLPVTSRKRFLEWQEVENILFRFSIITIDCYDNRLFQWNIKAIDFDLEDFKKFCARQIERNKKTRKNLNW